MAFSQSVYQKAYLSSCSMRWLSSIDQLFGIQFHEDATKAIESGDSKEISLGYKCSLEQVPGFISGAADFPAEERNMFGRIIRSLY